MGLTKINYARWKSLSQVTQKKQPRQTQTHSKRGIPKHEISPNHQWVSSEPETSIPLSQCDPECPKSDNRRQNCPKCHQRKFPHTPGNSQNAHLIPNTHIKTTSQSPRQPTGSPKTPQSRKLLPCCARPTHPEHTNPEYQLQMLQLQSDQSQSLISFLNVDTLGRFTKMTGERIPKLAAPERY